MTPPLKANPSGSSETWDRRHAQTATWPAPSRILTDHGHLLPGGGSSLDLACGLGADALWLAARGFDSHAFDRSKVAIERLEAEARRRALTVTARVVDVVAEPLPREGFAVIVVSRFLHRTTAPAIQQALAPGGLLYYQTFTRHARGGPSNPAFTLAENELLALFAPLVVRAYREDGSVGDSGLGERNMAFLVAQRPR
ncbi:MAG: class I SAM-dependent methyltransferase [Candidatus Competibacterales bacterium]